MSSEDILVRCGGNSGPGASVWNFDVVSAQTTKSFSQAFLHKEHLLKVGDSITVSKGWWAYLFFWKRSYMITNLGAGRVKVRPRSRIARLLGEKEKILYVEQ